MSSAILGTFFLAGCNLVQTDVSGHLSLTNSSGDSVELRVRITDRSSGETKLRESYEVPSIDTVITYDDVVTKSGNYNVEATVVNSDEAVSGVWRLRRGEYWIRVGVLSDRSLRLSGDGL